MTVFDYTRAQEEYAARLPAGIPSHMREGVAGYIIRGVPLGGFLSYIFANDFAHAAGKADEENKHALFAYAEMLHNAPIDCWGSVDKINAWVAHQGLYGIHREREAEGRAT